MSGYEAIDILLVEDSDADAEMAMRALRKGRVVNHIVRVNDGVEALELVHCKGKYAGRTGGSPRLVLLDLHMPKLGGIDVIRQLKAEPSTANLPIVVLTDSAQARDMIDGYNLGINGYLIKPFNFAAFGEVIVQVGFSWSVTERVAG